MNACPLPREYEPVNWSGSTHDAAGTPVRYIWSSTTLRAYLNESLRALSGHTYRNHSFKMIKVPARCFRGAIKVERGVDGQICDRDNYKLGVWMSRTLMDSQVAFEKRRASRNCTYVESRGAGDDGSDMPAETCYHVMDLLSDLLVPEWGASRQMLEQRNKYNCSRARGLSGRPNLSTTSIAKQKRTITHGLAPQRQHPSLWTLKSLLDLAQAPAK